MPAFGLRQPMTRVMGLVLAAVLLLAAAAWAFIFSGPAVTGAWCDGAYPVWMLEAQDYDGGGCVEVYSSHGAPPNADWRLYCVGLCNPAEYPANQDYDFP